MAKMAKQINSIKLWKKTLTKLQGKSGKYVKDNEINQELEVKKSMGNFHLLLFRETTQELEVRNSWGIFTYSCLEIGSAGKREDN